MTVRRVFHLTGVVGDCDGATAALVHLVGASVLQRVTDVTNGVEMHRALIGIGDSVLELLEPIGPSPFQGFLDRFGGGLSAVGVVVDDLAATRAHLAARSVDVAVDLGPDMFATRPAQLAGLAFQWSARGVPEDPRDAASPRPAGGHRRGGGRPGHGGTPACRPARDPQRAAGAGGRARCGGGPG